MPQLDGFGYLEVFFLLSIDIDDRSFNVLTETLQCNDDL